MLVIDIKTKGESHPISLSWRGNAEESRSLYEQIEDVSVRDGDANASANQPSTRSSHPGLPGVTDDLCYQLRCRPSPPWLSAQGPSGRFLRLRPLRRRAARH